MSACFASVGLPWDRSRWAVGWWALGGGAVGYYAFGVFAMGAYAHASKGVALGYYEASGRQMERLLG